MGARTGHFMPTNFVDSQFATPEPSTADENSLSIDKPLKAWGLMFVSS